MLVAQSWLRHRTVMDAGPVTPVTVALLQIQR